MAGVGKLLRLGRYSPGKLELPKLRLASSPAMPVRGMYFASHFGNFYEVAPYEDVDRLIEDLALWGCNNLFVWFDQHQYTDFHDPAAVKHFQRLKHFGQTAHRFGMKFGLTCLANEGYGASPPELRVAPGTFGAYGVEICPSKPGGLELIVKNLEEIALAFGEVDGFWLWPYDQGGCWCDECQPWGGNGFLRCCDALGEMYHRHFPEAEIWLSTWKMDYFPKTQGEIAGVLKWLDEKHPDWLSGIITGQDEYVLQQPLLDRKDPERWPLVAFPEISMYQSYPWGGFGATALPEFNERVEALMKPYISGGWPYSEGCYEDLSKWQWLAFYWAPERSQEEALAEWASYYLSPDVTGDFVKLSHLLEATHPRYNWVAQSLEQAPEAFELAEAIDARLPEWSQVSWRWRLFWLRARMDAILSEGSVREEATQQQLQPVCDELVRICSLQATHLRPPAFPQPVGEDNLAYGRPVTASSTARGYQGIEGKLTDGWLAQDDGENFWVNDRDSESASWVVIDLGKSLPISEVQLQFRDIGGTYWFIPSVLSFSTSEAGQEWSPLTFLTVHEGGGEAGPWLQTNHVPKEGAPYSADFWRYKVAGGSRPGRYLRVELGASQHLEEPWAGTLELVEVQVLGAKGEE